MRFFKYIFVFISLFFAQNALAAQCSVNVQSQMVVAASVINSSQNLVCFENCEHQLVKCVSVEDGEPSGTCTGVSTGRTCGAPPPYDCKQESCPVTEQQRCPVGYVKGMYNGVLSCVKNKTTDTLECSSDSCPNPEQKRCPANYYGGSVNGQSVCYKRTESADTDYPANEESEHFDIVSSVNNAKNAIVDSIYSLSDTLSTNFNTLLGKLDEVNSNGSQNTNGNTGGNSNGNGSEEGTNPDLSGFDVDVPHYELKENDPRFQLKQNNFSSNAVCPPDKVLNLPFLNRTFTYRFSFATICNGLQIIGYFILTMCYLYSANILVRI